jgi:hypothetical protein
MSHERLVGQKPDLFKQTHDSLLRTRVPSPEEKEFFEKRGWLFFDIKEKSLKQLLQEYPNYFGKLKGLTYSENEVVPAMTTALNLKHLTLPDSMSENLIDQIKMVERRSKMLERISPDVKMVILPPSAYVQADIAKKILPNFYARALHLYESDWPHDVSVGRDSVNGPLNVYDIGSVSSDLGVKDVVVVPAIVFTKK